MLLGEQCEFKQLILILIIFCYCLKSMSETLIQYWILSYCLHVIEVLVKILIVYYHLYYPTCDWGPRQDFNILLSFILSFYPLFLYRQSLYDNRENIQERFSLFWERVAKKFAGNSYVLGYELLNEPWAGDLYQFPDQVEPRKYVVYLLQ